MRETFCKEYGGCLVNQNPQCLCRPFPSLCHYNVLVTMLSNVILLKDLFLFCVYKCIACIDVGMPHVGSACRGQKRESYSLDLEFSRCMGVGN